MTSSDAGVLPDMYGQAPCGLLTGRPDGTLVDVNDTMLRWAGAARGDLIGRRFADLLTPGSRIYWGAAVMPLLHLSGQVSDVAVELRRPDGSLLPLLVTAGTTLDAGGTPAVLRIAAFDGTARLAHERDLVQARRAAEQATDRLGLLQSCTSALAEATATAGVVDALRAALERRWPAAEIRTWLSSGPGKPLRPADGKPSPSVVAGEPDPCVVRAADDRVVVIRSVGGSAAEHGQHLDGPVTVAVPLTAEGELIGVYRLTGMVSSDAAVTDVEMHRAVGAAAGAALKRARLHEELNTRAQTDPLTGLANRSVLTDRLAGALERARMTGLPVSTMFLDLDGFKAVNDRYGHRGGDALLVEVASKLRAAVRSCDLVARLGGDEFAVVCEGIPSADVGALAERVREATRGAALDGHASIVSVSIGVVVFDPAAFPRSTTAATLLRDADAAMYEAKAAGKNRHVVYDEAMDAELNRRVQIEDQLRSALDGNGIVVHYQPVLDLRDGRVVGVEALCRLDAGDGRLVGPDDFIPVAEDQGLVLALGRQVLETACATVVSWGSAADDVVLAVNVAAEQAARPDFAEMVLAVLRKTGLATSRLVLELTESTLLDASDATLEGLRRLRSEGLGIALDDFGTRYASLNYVQRLPLTALKIDRSFVAPLPGGAAERAIVRSVAQLAAELQLTCTAEGIETEEQRAFLAPLGVRGQGYALARPLSPEGCLALLEQRPPAGTVPGNEPDFPVEWMDAEVPSPRMPSAAR